MVFVPTHHSPVEPHEAAAAPRRPDHINVPSTSDGGKRLQWRAVVHAPAKDGVQTSWHLTECGAPLEPQAHCAERQRLMEAQQDPDGHCLVNSRCARCGDAPG
jgi:hypothetical protein